VVTVGAEADKRLATYIYIKPHGSRKEDVTSRGNLSQLIGQGPNVTRCERLQEKGTHSLIFNPPRDVSDETVCIAYYVYYNSIVVVATLILTQNE
jgi:hypothetical protein